MNAMSDIGAVASLRARMWDAGFRPVALKTGDKMPLIREWQHRARRDPPADADDTPRSDLLNTGILADGLRVIDIDVDDATTVTAVRAVAVERLGDTLVRTRANSPRCALLYRAAEGEPDKRVLAGRLGKVEVLGRGQQLHAFGLHPTGVDLTWYPEPPGDATREALPMVTENQVSDFFAAVAPLIEAEPAIADAPPVDEEPAPAPAQKPGADPLDVAAALAVIPNNGAADWEQWNNVGMATFAATGGSTSGIAAWCSWSERHPTHDVAAVKARWLHYRTSPPTKIGAGTLFMLAKQACPAWVKPTVAAARAKQANDAAEPPAMGILARSTCPAPALPLAVFGPFWAGWIAQAAEGANAPPDYVALPLLALASALLGNARWVVGWTGWAEPPALWCASVGNPSSGKSSGASPITRDVLARVEKHLSRDYPRDVEHWEEIAGIAKAVLKQWEKDVAKAIKKKEPVPDKPREAIVPPKPLRPRARVVDVTVEKLAAILEGLPKGVLYVRDELAAWLLNLSRYANGGTDRPFWLEGYVGGPMQVDRVKNPDPVFIPHLTIPIFGTIQPDRLAEVLGGADDGLSSRFLWAWPEAQPFRRPSGAGDIDAAAGSLLQLAGLLMNKDADGKDRPSYARLAPDAAELLAEFGRDMQTRETTAHGLMKSSLGKARGQALRLALVLEYLWWCGGSGATAALGDCVVNPEPQAVSLGALQAATGLMDSYFLPMARRVLGDASIPEEERLARTLATWIMETRPETVNVSSIRDGARLPGLRESAPVKAACRFLADARWLIAPPASTGPGRPRGDYIVNPKLWEAAA